MSTPKEECMLTRTPVAVAAEGYVQGEVEACTRSEGNSVIAGFQIGIVDTFFMYFFFVCSLCMYIYIYDIATHKYDSIVILSEFFVNDTETRKMSNEKELLIKTRRLYNIIMQ